MERAEVLKGIIEKLHSGSTVEEVKEEFKKHFENVSSEEIADAERLLMSQGTSVEEIQSLCDVHATLFEGSVIQPESEYKLGHPLEVFKAENEGIKNFIESKLLVSLSAFRSDNSNKASLLADLKSLSKIDKHYSRKENLLFPYLERAHISAPPKVMWGVDDEIRELIKKSISSVENDNSDAINLIEETLEQVFSMIKKENEILSPMLIEVMNEEDWKVVASESPQIGYVFTGGIEGASPSDAHAWSEDEDAKVESRNDDPIQLPSGFFKNNELTALLNTLPCDVTFVGADDKVHFFSEQENRVFPRTRTIIGRDVANCHPPKSLEAVEKLVEAFKDGSKDSESYWISKGDLFILIRYFAVRDVDGTYLGVLECTEEISELRSLEGNKTLMSE
ncbi:MAG: DUF438 domain-containing protein [Erysipelotrichaceae bacterium]|nr:DUF438 domain-containing protein [Erysipelotrichaceae bacterium]